MNLSLILGCWFMWFILYLGATNKLKLSRLWINLNLSIVESIIGQDTDAR